MKSHWLYEGETLTDIPTGYAGFVYKITNNETGKRYIGRKYFYQRRKPKYKTRRKTVESNWKTYTGSCKQLNEDISAIGKLKFSFDILELCETEALTNYMETKMLFFHDVLFARNEKGNRAYYNSNINGKYHWLVNE